MSTVRPSPRVFVSHNHNDEEFCRAFVDGLRARGIDVWYDEDNLGWEPLHDEISRELDSRRHFIVILSPSAVKSRWVTNEINAALALEDLGQLRSFVPVVAQKCAVPTFLRGRRRVENHDGTPLSPEEACSRVYRIIVARDPVPQESLKVPPDVLPASLARLNFTRRIIQDMAIIRQPLCTIPAGSFMLGSDETDPEAFENEFPAHAVDVPAFQITRFPITVAEFACYVRAGGAEPGKGANIDWSTQLKRLDHPVVCVTWQQACDYADWFGKATGNPTWRLPTESEWEKAARWEAATGKCRIYPWDDVYEVSRCNVNESGIGTTTPVDRYPSGASPSGVRDMSGNVWEWTSTLASPYGAEESRAEQDQNGDRIIRGGSWFDTARDARATSRLPYDPEDYPSDLGFRLVCAPLAQ